MQWSKTLWLAGMLGNCVQFQQVIPQLLVNSLHALASAEQISRRIELASGLAGSGISLSVRDNGAGIALEDLGRISTACSPPSRTTWVLDWFATLSSPPMEAR